MIICLVQPMPVEAVMDSRPMCHGPFHEVSMGMGDSHCIVTASAKTPNHDVRHTEYLFAGHPVKDTIP